MQCRVPVDVRKVHVCLRRLQQRLHAPHPSVDARADQRCHPLHLLGVLALGTPASRAGAAVCAAPPSFRRVFRRKLLLVVALGLT
eukprot:scaffold111975_cov63-Phaeocystis_antarctica.AAC.3